MRKQVQVALKGVDIVLRGKRTIKVVQFAIFCLSIRAGVLRTKK